MWAKHCGFLSDIEPDEESRFLDGFLSYLETKYASTLDNFSYREVLDDEIVENLTDAIDEFKKDFTDNRGSVLGRIWSRVRKIINST